MSIRLINVKRYKRGASWPDGQTRMCVRCAVERTRGRQAMFTALRLEHGFRMPVAYCSDHEPEGIELRGGGSDGERQKTTEPTPQANRSLRAGRLV